MLYTVLKIILFLCLFTAFCAFFYYLGSSNLIGRKVKEVYTKLDKAAVTRSRRLRKSIGIQAPKSFLEKCIEKPERRFIYSGIGNKFQGVTIELWLLMILFSAAGVYVLAFIITKTLGKALVVTGIYIGLIEFVESILILKNYIAVDRELLEFLNMISNFSITNGEITGVFRHISRFMKEPLKTELEECYYEAHTSGDSKAALEALADKIEHPMFKDIVRNLVICVNYSANYREVINSSRKIIREEQKAREERKAIGKAATLNLSILSIMLLTALCITDQLISKSIWTILFHTTLGQTSLAIIVIVYLIFTWKVSSVDR